MELTTHEDKITGLMGRLKGREHARASEAGEDRQEIGQMLELTGLNKKAFSFVRSVDKMEPEKREDVLRSLNPLLSMMQPHWDGQSTPDMLDGAAPVSDAENEPDDDYDPQAMEPGEHNDPETDEFDAAVDAVADDEGNVVTPIDFSGDAA